MAFEWSASYIHGIRVVSIVYPWHSSDNWTSKVIENPCAVSCNYSTYPMSLSYATIPNNNVAEQVEKYHSVTLEEIKDSYVFVDVYYSQIQYEQYTQTEAMTSSALLSDVGGQLGLFIGISVITLIEIFEYISKKIAGLCCKAKKVNSIDGELDEIQN
ncbi:acid-sensing ion channel 1B-like [Saccoglossus kowalevskii]